MGMEATGKIHTLFDTVQVSERFTKREFVVEMADNPKYPQVVMFQITGDRIAQLDGMSVGDQVRIEFSLRGREWTSPKGERKFFNTLDVWKVEPMGERKQQSAKAPDMGKAADAPADPADDCPF